MKQRTYWKEEMKDELMRIYREVSQSGFCRNQQEAYEMTVTHPAPRYYVDARWAHQRLSPMLRGDRSGLEKINPLTREMYENLFDTVLRLSQNERYWGCSTYELIRNAIMQPAPRFYISTRRMGQIFHERRKQRIRRCSEKM